MQNYNFQAKISLAIALTSFVIHLLHPFQVAKIKINSKIQLKGYQNQNKGRIINVFKQICKNQGFFGLYKGFTITYLYSTFGRLSFFIIYQKVKKIYNNNNTLTNFKASTIASLISISLIFPLTILRTRIILNKNYNESQYTIISIIKQIKKQYGIKGFYRGLIISYPMCLQGILTMVVYEQSFKTIDNITTQTIKSFISGIIAKFTSIIATYPLISVRIRIQQKLQHDEVNTIREAIKHIKKYHGIRGFYRGICANFIRQVPSKGIFMTVYQKLKNLLKIGRNDGHN